MTGPVCIDCESVENMQPIGRAGNRAISLELRMTDRQCREAVLNLLGGMPEQQSCEWLRSEFPAWFETPGVAQ